MEMLCYKYQKAGNLSFNMLRRGEVYFASVDDLNDANECRSRFIFKGSEELWQRLSYYILQHVCFSSDYFHSDRLESVRPILRLSDPIGTSLKEAAGKRDLGIESLSQIFREALERHFPDGSPDVNRGFVLHLVQIFIEKQLPRALYEEKYIASFSLSATNPTMWGHYADAERGFVVVYSTTDGSIHVHSPAHLFRGQRPSRKLKGVMELGIYKDEHLKLKEVTYGKRPPKVNAFHRLIHKFSYSEMEDYYDVPALIAGDAEEKQEDLIGLIKYSDWRYEKEIRAFLPVLGPVPPDARVLQVGISHIKGVIFGPRMSQRHKARILVCCYLMVKSNDLPTEKGPELQFFQARQTVNRFDFEILPVGILDKDYFGDSLPLKPMNRLDENVADRLRAAAELIAAPSRSE